MARSLAEMDALVVGIDITHFLKAIEQEQDSCAYVAGDLEALGQFVQKKLNLKDYPAPVLVGYSSGATLVYLALAQAPAGTFKGAISLGFCGNLMLRKPACQRNGLVIKQDQKLGQIFSAVPVLSSPWIVIQGAQDQVCDLDAAKRFRQVENAEVVPLDKVGHGFSVQRNWMPQFRTAFSHVVDVPKALPPAAGDVSGLPLVEVPAAGERDLFAVMLTGDGGWARIDRDLAGSLARSGIPVVGWDSLRYFWTPRDPLHAAADLERIIRYYRHRWKKKRSLLLGYSLGADVLPFLASRLPVILAHDVPLIGLLSPGSSAQFEFHLSHWLGGGSGGLPVAPEIHQFRGAVVLCIYGKDDHESVCPQ